MAWAKSRFETYFSSEVQLVAKLRDILLHPVSTPASPISAVEKEKEKEERLEQVRTWLGTLSEDQVQGVARVLEDQPWTAQGAQKVCVHN